ncbi:MAG: hypothetical protein D6731_10945 [Planctomycetota bacterium]|nr:MAG: hypothetical protein D6731_10945 [Planctomycetota bacterium]
MPRSTRLLVLLLASLAWGARLAHADEVFLKNGNVVRGKAHVDRARGRVTVEREGASSTFDLDDVVRIVEGDDGRSAPKDPPPTQAAAAVVVVPLHGAFDTRLAARTFDDALANALSRKPKLIVFELSSPGGLLDVGRHFVRRIRELRAAGVRSAAFVYGPHHGAYSAAAYVALACERIYMAPGQAIGAAVAYRPDRSGIPRAVGAKFDSAWQAEFRANAEASGHPGALAGAMVSDAHGVAELLGKASPRFVPATAVLGQEDPPPHRILCRPGQVLTLTSREARRVRLSRGTAEDTDDFLTKLRFAPTERARLADPLAAARQRIARLQAKLDEDLAAYRAVVAKVVSQAPGNHRYPLDRSGRFADGGRAWRRRTKAAQKYVRRALSALERIDARLREFPDLRANRKGLAQDRARLQRLARELTVHRRAERPPR